MHWSPVRNYISFYEYQQCAAHVYDLVKRAEGIFGGWIFEDQVGTLRQQIPQRTRQNLDEFGMRRSWRISKADNPLAEIKQSV